MIIIVPTERFALEELLQSIDGQDIARIIDKLSHSYPQLVALWLPKFSIETSYSLVESMKKVRRQTVLWVAFYLHNHFTTIYLSLSFSGSWA